MKDQSSVSEIEMGEKDRWPQMSAKERLKRVTIFLLVAAVYASLWAAYLTHGDLLWTWSLDLSLSATRWPACLKLYFQAFSGPFYKWNPFLMSLLFMLAPMKESALKAICVYICSHTARQYIRMAFLEKRPIFDDSKQFVDEECSCSFGFPSGHSEGAATMYMLIIYELIVTNKKIPARTKTISKLLGLYIVLSVMMSRLYFGKHSIPQVLIGAWQSLVCFFLAYLFEDKLNNFFWRFLTRKEKHARIVFSLLAATTVANIAMWFLHFDKVIRQFSSFTSVRCDQCFEDGLYAIRKDMIMSLQAVVITAGVFAGLLFLKPNKLIYTRYLHEQLGFKGLKRLVLMALLHAPLGVALLPWTGISLDAYFALITVFYFFGGMIITYGFSSLTRRWGLAVDGDMLAAGGEESDQYQAQQTEELTLDWEKV